MSKRTLEQIEAELKKAAADRDVMTSKLQKVLDREAELCEEYRLAKEEKEEKERMVTMLRDPSNKDEWYNYNNALAPLHKAMNPKAVKL
jgi:hypothetical protein